MYLFPFYVCPTAAKEWVHVIPMPDMFRGPHAGKPDAAEMYFQDAKRVIEAAVARGRKVRGQGER